MNNIISGIINNKEFVAILISFLGIIVPMWQYLNSKNKEQKQKNFENFHIKLLKTLTAQEGHIGLEEQVATIFELRNFSKYFPVIRRMLVDKKQAIIKNEIKNNPHLVCVIKEIDETITYIDKNFIMRFFVRVLYRL